jgi:hypothetical protein
LGEDSYGWKALIEPDERFEIGLAGNGAYPDAEWRIVEMDSEVIKLLDIDYTSSSQASEWSPDAPGPLLSYTIHVFTGGTLGESLLVLEVEVDGQLVDRYQVTVAVVEDACDFDDRELTGIIAANRCGG